MAMNTSGGLLVGISMMLDGTAMIAMALHARGNSPGAQRTA